MVDAPIIDNIPGGPEHLFTGLPSPTTWPGARLPHSWMDGGAPYKNLIPGDGYKRWLRLKSQCTTPDPIEGGPFKGARGAPLTVLDLYRAAGARIIRSADLLLLRA